MLLRRRKDFDDRLGLADRHNTFDVLAGVLHWLDRLRRPDGVRRYRSVNRDDALRPNHRTLRLVALAVIM